MLFVFFWGLLESLVGDDSKMRFSTWGVLRLVDLGGESLVLFLFSCLEELSKDEGLASIEEERRMLIPA